MDVIQIIGYLSGIIIAISLLPQVIKSWSTKSTRDVSLLWTLIAFLGLLLYTIYGIGIKEMPIIATNILEMILVMSLIVAKQIYK